MPTLTFEFDEKAFDDWSDDLKKALRDVSDVWPVVIHEFYQIENEQFDTQGHGKWAPLSPAYAKWKAAHFPGRSLLVQTEKLKTEATGGGSISATPQQLSIAFRGVPYFKFHQQGTSRMPARKPIDLTPGDKQRIIKVFKQAVLDRIRKTR